MTQITPIKAILAGLAAAAALALTGCGQNTDDQGIHHMMIDQSAEAHGSHTGDHHDSGETMNKPNDAREVTIIATDFAFDPDTVTAVPSEKLYVKLVNQGKAVHMWQLEGKPETHVHTEAGETTAKTIVAPENPGDYKIY